MPGLDDFSERLKQLGEDEGAFNEEDLIKEILSDLTEVDGIKSLKDLKTLMGTLTQAQGKFKDMEKGHTQATQRLSQMEEALKGRGVADIDAFLSGGPAKKVDRKQQTQDWLRKNVNQEHIPFYEGLLDLTKPEPDMSSEMTMNLLGEFMEFVFFDQFNRDERYKGVDDDTKAKLSQRLRDEPKAMLDGIKNKKNPLHDFYSQHFATTNPEVMQKKIEEKAQEKLEAERSSHLERPDAGRAPARIETDTQKAQEERADQVKEQTGIDLRE